ncbi:hypothetical protein AK830_g4337 [Neonectria ditissima]|uniref:Transporter n=1 Tax=Neonectria ditissima TaxID=78410 RepID=A0A0N8H7N1_9HYPO|nr:hypothetical protein AK830_g4337 [Neonectria ditissima]
MDTGFWQKGFAVDVVAAVPGYILGGNTYFAIPFTFGTVVGLVGALALELTPVWLTYLRLTGKGGAVAILLILFMACTSVASVQLIAVSLIVSFDVYGVYVNKKPTNEELIRWSYIGVVGYSLFFFSFATAFHKGGVDLNWTIYMLGVVICPGTIPTVLSLLWRGQSRIAATAAPTAYALYGEISVASTGKTLPCMYACLTSMFVPLPISLVISWLKPQNFEWEEFLKIERVGAHGDETKGGFDHDAYFTPVKVRYMKRMSKLADVWAAVTFLGHVVLWPLPMYGAKMIFSKALFVAWVVVGLIWLFLTLLIANFHPLYDGGIKQIWQVVGHLGRPATKVEEVDNGTDSPIVTEIHLPATGEAVTKATACFNAAIRRCPQLDKRLVCNWSSGTKYSQARKSGRDVEDAVSLCISATSWLSKCRNALQVRDCCENTRAWSNPAIPGPLHTLFKLTAQPTKWDFGSSSLIPTMWFPALSTYKRRLRSASGARSTLNTAGPICGPRAGAAAVGLTQQPSELEPEAKILTSMFLSIGMGMMAGTHNFVNPANSQLTKIFHTKVSTIWQSVSVIHLTFGVSAVIFGPAVRIWGKRPVILVSNFLAAFGYIIVIAPTKSLVTLFKLPSIYSIIVYAVYTLVYIFTCPETTYNRAAFLNIDIKEQLDDGSSTSDRDGLEVEVKGTNSDTKIDCREKSSADIEYKTSHDVEATITPEANTTYWQGSRVYNGRFSDEGLLKARVTPWSAFMLAAVSWEAYTYGCSVAFAASFSVALSQIFTKPSYSSRLPPLS